MASQFIGAVVGMVSGNVVAIINPDDDSELDNPRMLLIRSPEAEPMTMVKIPRDEYMRALSLAEVAMIIKKLQG